MIASRMKKPVMLVFKVDANKYQVFRVDGWKVKAEFIIEDDGTALSCDCQMFRFESDCAHVRGINKKTYHTVHGATDRRQSDKEIQWRDADAFKYVAELDQKDPDKIDSVVPGVMSFDLGDLSLFNLVWVLTEDKPTDEIAKLMVDENSFLNPRRIYEECKVSVDNGVAATDDIVQTAGKAITPLTKKDLPIKEEFNVELGGVVGKAVTTPEPVIVPDVHAHNLTVDWDKVPRPHPATFYVLPEVWEQLCFAVAYGENALLIGPQGSGKSELGYMVAQGMGYDIDAFNFGATQEPRQMLIGNTNFDKVKGTWFSKSRFVKAIERDRGVVLLDELTRDRGASAHNIILTLLDRQGYLALDEDETTPVIKKGDGVAFLGTANIGAQYTGTEALDAALRGRFGTIVDLTWPPKEYEIKILMNRSPGLRAGDAAKLVDFANRQREMYLTDGSFCEGGEISTRMLLAAGKRIGKGMTLENALTFSVVNHFPSEGGDSSERTMLRQVFQKNA